MLVELLKEYLGSIGVVLFFLGYQFVRYLNGRAGSRNRVQVAEIAATGKRDELALELEKEAAAYLRDSLADARAEIRTLRGERDAARADLNEAKNNIVDMTALHKSGMRAFALRIEFLERAIEDARGRETELRFRLYRTDALARTWREMLWRSGCLDLEPLALLPAWIRQEDDEPTLEPRRLPPGDEEPRG